MAAAPSTDRLMMKTTDISPPKEIEVLRRFVSLLLESPPPQPWEQLFSGDGHRVARLSYFLLHRDPGQGTEPGVDTEGFVIDSLARILRQLNSRTEREHIESQGRIRGKIIWPATLKQRYTGGYDPTRFVCRESRRHFDTLENQLLRYLIEAIWQAIPMVPDTIRAGACYHPATNQVSQIGVADRLKKMQDLLLLFRKHGRLQQVSLPDAVTEEQLWQAERSKMAEYGLVARLYRRYQRAMNPGSWDGVIQLGRMVLPLPAQAAGEGEAWLRLAAAVVRAG